MNEELQELIFDVREQVRYFGELGVDAINVTLSDRSAIVAADTPAAAVIPDIKFPQSQSADVKPPEVSRLAGLPSLTKRKPLVPNAAPPISSPEVSRTILAPLEGTTSETIEDIRNDIGDCVRCPLHTGRSQVVHSTGNFQADLMFVGEAPGANEDAEGEPFVGRAGQLLTKIIEGIQLRREDVFIGNINRCRPPGNRAPEPAEAAVCKPFLFREIAVVRPKVIVVLGATAAQNLLETKVPISKLRGQFHEYLGTKVMPTFHPAYLLRDPHKKREVWEDMKMVRDYLMSA